MPDADIIVVGSGPSGAFAAYALRGRNVLVLDVGHRAGPSTLQANLYDVRRGSAGERVDTFAELIGPEFESLHNVFHRYVSPKLKGPQMRFVTRDADRLAPVSSEAVDHDISLAAGGMANAWGAGLYPFSASDFDGYPIGLADIEPYYRAIVAKVGVSGMDDDLSRFFGAAEGLQPPVDLPSIGRTLLGRYAAKRDVLNRKGLYVGRPRLAVLTQDHDGRHRYRYEALEFFRPNDRAVYNPSYTLDEMIQRHEIRYQPQVMVERFSEHDGVVHVHARDARSGEPRDFQCRRLILAAGTLNTTRIVLQSGSDVASELPLLDTPLSYIPLVDPWSIGAGLDQAAYSAAMLSAIYVGDRASRPLQLTLYAALGTLRSDYLFDFPLSMRGSLAAARYVTPALLVAQATYPDDSPSIFVRLGAEGRLQLRSAATATAGIEAHLLRLFRTIGYYGLAGLCRRLRPGSSYRFAGSLPMRAEPGRYQTSRDGLLHGARAVFVADAAVLNRLPSKNHSFTMMANAMRIADAVGRTLS
jgi:choline dehydrogenase-like flavoprotein